ncbi:kinetochore protein SPC25 homolog [Impatiens glandulifera]|uniref:kinetochore protein SPC25 homolog n=1 Tax=Impatiens glandulifera TaxID=253017 RepID=UPI001FB0C840|nr:kinetochore protein SPC25 homolog [Impatiens glandulifera]
MKGSEESSYLMKIKELRTVCDVEIPIRQQRLDSIAVFLTSLDSLKEKSKETLQNQGNTGKLKATLRDADDELVEALGVKTRKEAAWMAILDTLSARRKKVRELKQFVEEAAARKYEYADIIATQAKALLACEEKHKKQIEQEGGTDDVISWYNGALGFRIECGHGVKFIFTNIDEKNPKEEYSFTVRYDNDSYSLLECDPLLKDTKELVAELNKSNGLFKFVRIMREKFVEAAGHGIVCQGEKSVEQYSSTIAASAPVSSASTDSNSEIQPIESKRKFMGRGSKPTILSPESALSLRRSPRFKGKR